MVFSSLPPASPPSSPLDFRFRRWIYLLLALAVVGVTGVTSLLNEKSRNSIDLSMNGSRVLYGLTVATSHHQFGSPLYGFYLPVFDTFFTKQTMSWKEVNGLIRKARSIDPATLKDKLHIGFGELDEDDKGVILWYSAAFELFGPHLASIYLLYFLLLSGSIVTYWLALRDDEPALILLALYPLVHMTLTSFTLASNPDVTGSLLGSRPFAMLAVLPTLHLVLLIARQHSPSRWLVAGVAYQILFFLLIIAVRSSAKIQLLFILLVAAFMFLLWIKNTPYRWQLITSGAILHSAFAWVPIALITGLISMSLAYALAVPHELRARAATGHLVWYPALAGFVQNPKLYEELVEFSKLYKPKGVNTGIYDEKGNLNKSPSPDALARMSVIGYASAILHEDIADSIVGGPDKRNPNTYERYAKRMFFYELRTHPGDMLRLYLVNKTRGLLGMMQNTLRQLHLADVFAAAFILGLLGGAAWLQGLIPVALVFGLGFGISSIPAYWFVAAPHVMYDYAPYFCLALLAAVATAGSLIASITIRYSLFQRFKPLFYAVFPIFLMVGITGMLLVKRLPGTGDKSTIVVVSATYGVNVKAPAGNATSYLRRACNGHASCDYTIDVNILGDPMGGAAKDFAVEYECSYELKPIRKTIPAEAHTKTITLDCSQQ